MSKLLSYLLLVVIAGTLLCSGCSHVQKKINWTVSLKEESKDPYGTYVFRQSLPYYFPNAKISELPQKYKYANITNEMYGYNHNALLVMLGLDFHLSEAEWRKLKDYVRSGNEVLIITQVLDHKITSDLSAIIYGRSSVEQEMGTIEVSDTASLRGYIQLVSDTSKMYTYRGRSIGGAISLSEQLYDSAGIAAVQKNGTTFYVTDTLGTGKNGINFARFRYGNGHITLHAAPLVFSNYFLLQNDNKAYLDGIWHTFPKSINKIYYNEYFKRTAEVNNTSVLMRYRETKFAILLALFTLGMFVLMNIKRKQRIIPIVEEKVNTTVSFVETIGKLYYNKGNHANLAEKMIQHFLEWVRGYYYIDTSAINTEFAKHLSAKSGKSLSDVLRMVDAINEVREGHTQITTQSLFDLYELIQSYYENEK